MKILGLDISTKTGWAVLEAEEGSQALMDVGLVQNEFQVADYAEGRYPWSFVSAAASMARDICAIVANQNPDVIVIEETNLGRNRYSQKVLEFIHCSFLRRLREQPLVPTIVYLSSSTWRRALGQGLSKDQKKANAKLGRAKREAESMGLKLDKKAVGIKGKITKKHIAITYVNERFSLALKMKDNDIADAICLTCAYADNFGPGRKPAVGFEICNGS